MTDHNSIFSPFTQEAVGRLLRRREGRNVRRPTGDEPQVDEAFRSVEPATDMELNDASTRRRQSSINPKI